MKITPGPWDCTTRQGSWDWVVFQKTSPNIEICQPFHDGTEFNEVGEANARLIAAAPDLFDACAGVWAALADTDDPKLAAIARECDAALTKARGID